MLQSRLSPAQDVPPPSGANKQGMPSSITVSRAFSAQSSPVLPSPRAWALVLATFALAAIASFAGFYLRIAPSARASTRRAAWGTVHSRDLGMRLATQGRKILVSWNRRAPALKSATHGLLSIDDGTQHRNLDLPSAQLANGSLRYEPASQDVTFRLEIDGSDGTLVKDVARMLIGSSPTPLRVAAVEEQEGRRRVATSSVESSKWQRAAPDAARPKQLPEPMVNRMTEVAEKAVLPEFRFDPDRASATLPLHLVPEALPIPAAPQTGGVRSGPVLIPSASSSSSLPNNPGLRTSVIYIGPKPLKQVMPNLPPGTFSKLRDPAQIQVELKIDEQGRVTTAAVVGSRSSAIDPLLAASVTAAARQWTFAPAKLRGKSVPADHVIEFRFRPTVH